MEGGCTGMGSSLISKTVNSYLVEKSKILKITDDTFFIIFKGVDGLDYHPGQFCMIAAGENSLTRKPFTLGKYGNSPTISVKIVGDGSRYIVESTEKIDMLAPLGNAFTPDGKNGAVLVAPSCFAEGLFISDYFDVPLYVVSKIPFDNDFIEHFKNEKISFFVGNDAYLSLLSELNSSSYDWTFISGSKVMEKLAVERLSNKLTYVSLNEYMGCGIGACKSCAVETQEGIKHVCTDGPVLRGDEVWTR